MSKKEIKALATALRAADWSNVSVGNKALIEAAAANLETLSAKLESRRVLLDQIRTHMIDKNVLANFGPELFEIINNHK